MGTAAFGALLWLTCGSAQRSEEPAGSLKRLAVTVTASLSEHRAEAPIGLWVRADSPELARAFSTVLAAELARAKLPAVPLEEGGPAEAERTARAKGLRSLVRLTLSLENGVLAARGDLLGTWVNFWAGAAATRPPSPAAALDAATEADAHALSLAALTSPQPPHKGPGELKLSGAVFARLALPPAALAMGDLDGDGKAEVVALTDEEVLVFSAGGKLLARRELKALPGSPTPCREPFGALAVSGRRVWAASARHARGEVLALERGTLKPTGAQEALLAFAGAGEERLEGTFVPGENVFAPAITYRGNPVALPGGAIVGASVRASLSARSYLFVMPGGSGLLYSAASAADPAPFSRPPQPLSALGAGSALADLDGDGRPELVTSSARYAPEADELRAVSLAGNVPGPELWRSGELPRGVRVVVLAAGDLDGDGADELIAGLWLPDGTGELDVFRRVAP